MISAGNDIVALKAVDLQRTQLPAYYLKFITEAELALFEHSALPFTTFVWLLWSIKESAYKYLKRITNDLIFSPKKIVVQQLTLCDLISNKDHLKCKIPIHRSYVAVIEQGDMPVYFRSVISDHFIATTATGKNVFWGIKLIDGSNYKTQSEAVRLLALSALKDLVPFSDLWIDKHPEGNYPILMAGETAVDIALSFAHHDRYVSYSFQIPK